MQRARTAEAKEKRRRALLAAALDEFVERGFAAARMDDIAARAGLSKGTLYLYFDSKEAVFAGLVDAVALPNVAQMEAFLKETPSARAALKRLMAFLPHLVRDTPLPHLAKVLIADAGAFPEVARRYRTQVIDRVLAAIAALLERGRAAGELAVDDPALTARLVVAPVLMSAVWRVVFESDPAAHVDLDALFATHEKMLLRALGAGDGA